MSASAQASTGESALQLRRYWKRLAATLWFASLGAGCAPVVLNYAPSSTLSATGEVIVGYWRYIPSIQGSVKPNQIRNTALGTVLFEKNVSEYFRQAVFTELRFVGIRVNQGKSTVAGDIEEFLIDDLGFSVDWTLNVRYTVTMDDDTICYDQVKTLNKNTDKFANPFGTLNVVIRENIEQLIADPEFLTCIAQPTV